LTRRGGGPEGNDVARGQRVASRFLAEMSAAFSRNRPVLEALGARYRLGVVSNFYGNLEAVCESSGLAGLFGVMTDSQCVGSEKPEPAIFQVALDALQAKPATTVMVGDSLRRDYEGARRSGMGFIWIAPEDVQAAERVTGADRSVLGSVTELPDILHVLT
jgi:HAD superfamily hydrolase (TIGR01509 family)